MKSLVIIPTYNEKENIGSILEYICSLNNGIHILVIDDNSPDGTASIVNEKINKYMNLIFIIERKNKLGLGSAYITGFKWAIENLYDFVFEMDADFSHDPNDLITLERELKENNVDMIIGSRYINGVSVVNWPIKRILLSFFASKYVNFITGMNIKDSTSGFVGYKIETLKKLNLDSVKFIGYTFQIEMKYRLLNLGFKLKEIPIIFRNRTKGVSKMSINIVNEAIFGVIILRMKKLFGKLK